MENEKFISDFYYEASKKYDSNKEVLQYFYDSLLVIKSILRGETDSLYWSLETFIKHFKPKTDEERSIFNEAKRIYKKYNHNYLDKAVIANKDPERFDSLSVAKNRINEVFKWLKNIRLDFTEIENLLYAFLKLTYSLLTVFNNVDKITIPDDCINKYENSQQQYLRLICDMAYLNFNYARRLAEFDEREEETEKEYTEMLNNAYALVPDGDIVNSIFAIDAIDSFFRNPSEQNSNSIYEIKQRNTKRNVVKDVLTLSNGEIEFGSVGSARQYLPHIEVQYDTDFDEIEFLRPKTPGLASECEGELNMLFKTPLLIGLKTSEGATIYWLISLLGDSYTKQHELEEMNADLNRHIKLNQELIRSLTHSSANFLNSKKLEQTGIELKAATDGTPTIDRLHYDGMLLMLQSEHEKYLRRRLDSLVIRCSASGEELKRNIREGISKESNATIILPLEYSLKTIISRILTHDNDIRSEAIRKKFNKTAFDWSQLKESFITNILANNDSVLQWSNQNLCHIDYKLSEIWQNVRLIEDRTFFDLIVEILTEQLLNAFSHGDMNEVINIEFGQADEIKIMGSTIPKWCYIKCNNTIGVRYESGIKKGLETLNSTLLLINGNKRGIETNEKDGIHCTLVWLEADLLRPLKGA